MKKKLLVMMVSVLMIMPATIFAADGHGDHGDMKGMNHGDMKGMNHGDMKGMDHGDMKGMDHGDMKGMDHGDNMIMLGSEVVDGVKAVVHLNDVREKMAKHGMKQTHHIMIAFEDAETGKAIESGSAAVKIEDPDENIGKAIKLMGMAGHFGVDITLDKKGMYHFKIGTKLVDGMKRMFHFHVEN